MVRLKRRWDENFPNKSHVSKQNLRDNAKRFKKELENTGIFEQENEEMNNVQDNKNKWANVMNLLKIEECERKKGRGFMKRMKGAWDKLYANNQISAQTLRDSALRFRKDKLLLNLIEVRNEEHTDGELESIEVRDEEPDIREPVVDVGENKGIDENVEYVVNAEK